MSEAKHPLGSCATDPLWVDLLAYTIGPQDAALSFAKRLAQENGWSLARADEVIFEYKRFCYLARRASHPVTPSDAVDQVWHLHLTYSRDYWERFCPDILGKPLHHGPTMGGKQESERFSDQYAQTLASYAVHFGHAPPRSVWPSADDRAREDTRAERVILRDHWIVPKRKAVIAYGIAFTAALGWYWYME